MARKITLDLTAQGNVADHLAAVAKAGELARKQWGELGSTFGHVMNTMLKQVQSTSSQIKRSLTDAVKIQTTGFGGAMSRQMGVWRQEVRRNAQIAVDLINLTRSTVVPGAGNLRPIYGRMPTRTIPSMAAIAAGQRVLQGPWGGPIGLFGQAVPYGVAGGARAGLPWYALPVWARRNMMLAQGMQLGANPNANRLYGQAYWLWQTGGMPALQANIAQWQANRAVPSLLGRMGQRLAGIPGTLGGALGGFFGSRLMPSNLTEMQVLRQQENAIKAHLQDLYRKQAGVRPLGKGETFDKVAAQVKGLEKELRNTEKAKESLAKNVEQKVPMMAAHFKAFGRVINSVFTGIGNMAGVIGQRGSDMFNQWSIGLGYMAGAGSTWLRAMTIGVARVIGAFSRFLGVITYLGSVLSKIPGVGPFLGMIVKTVGGALQILTSVAGVVLEAWMAATRVITIVVEKILRMAYSLIRGIISAVGSAISTITSLIGSIIGVVGSIFGRVYRIIRNTFFAAAGVVVYFVQSAAREFTRLDQSIAQSVGQLARKPGIKGAITDLALSLSRAWRVDPKQVSEALFIPISAGLTDLNRAGKLFQSAMKLTIAGGLTDVAPQAKALTAVLAALGWTEERAAEAAEVLYVAQANAIGNMEEFARNVQRSIVTGTALGFNLRQITAFAALATQGLGGLAVSYRGVEQAMIRLGGGYPAFNKQMAASGMQMAKFKSGAPDLLGTLENIKRKLDAMKPDQRAAAIRGLFPNVRAFLGIAATTNRAFDEMLSMFKKIQYSTGALDEAVKVNEKSWFRLVQGLTAAWTEFKDRTAIALGPFLEPLLRAATGWITKMSDAIASLTKEGAFEKLAGQFNVLIDTVSRAFMKSSLGQLLGGVDVSFSGLTGALTSFTAGFQNVLAGGIGNNIKLAILKGLDALMQVPAMQTVLETISGILAWLGKFNFAEALMALLQVLDKYLPEISYWTIYGIEKFIYGYEKLTDLTLTILEWIIKGISWLIKLYYAFPKTQIGDIIKREAAKAAENEGASAAIKYIEAARTELTGKEGVLPGARGMLNRTLAGLRPYTSQATAEEKAAIAATGKRMPYLSQLLGPKFDGFVDSLQKWIDENPVGTFLVDIVAAIKNLPVDIAKALQMTRDQIKGLEKAGLFKDLKAAFDELQDTLEKVKDPLTEIPAAFTKFANNMRTYAARATTRDTVRRWWEILGDAQVLGKGRQKDLDKIAAQGVAAPSAFGIISRLRYGAADPKALMTWLEGAATSLGFDIKTGKFKKEVGGKGTIALRTAAEKITDLWGALSSGMAPGRKTANILKWLRGNIGLAEIQARGIQGLFGGEGKIPSIPGGGMGPDIEDYLRKMALHFGLDVNRPGELPKLMGKRQFGAKTKESLLGLARMIDKLMQGGATMTPGQIMEQIFNIQGLQRNLEGPAGKLGILKGQAPSFQIEDLLKNIRAPEIPKEIVAIGKAGADLSVAATALTSAATSQQDTNDYLLAGLSFMFGFPPKAADS